MSDRPIVSVEDNRIEYRASALGMCIRALAAARAGFEQEKPPPALQVAFDEGHEYEPIILARLEHEHGWTLGERQKRVELQVAPGIFVVGHMDALGESPTGDGMTIDAKAFGNRFYTGFAENGLAAFPRYGWQQSVYAIGMGGSAFCLPILNKATDELHVYVYYETPFSFEDIKQRVLLVEQFARENKSLYEIECDGDWGCPFSYLHDEKAVGELSDEATALAVAYTDCKAKEDAFALGRKAIAQKLIKVLPHTDTLRTFTGEGYKVSVVRNASRLDTGKLKQLLIDADLDVDDYTIPGKGEHIVVKGATNNG